MRLAIREADKGFFEVSQQMLVSGRWSFVISLSSPSLFTESLTLLRLIRSRILMKPVGAADGARTCSGSAERRGAATVIAAANQGSVRI